MDADDPEKRIADLERQLAQQRRIAELERQIAEAKAAAGQDTDEPARRYAESLWEGLRTGAPAGPDGPSEAELAQHREAFSRAAADAGLSQAQLDDIFTRGNATVRVGRSVSYSGLGPPPTYSPLPGSQAGRQQPRKKFGGANRVGAILGLLGVCVGAGAAVTAMFPSSALWMSPIVCSSPYQLTYSTSHYSYQPGQSGTTIDFQCVSDQGAYSPSLLAIDGLQSLMVTVILGTAVVVGVTIWRRLRKPA